MEYKLQAFVTKARLDLSRNSEVKMNLQTCSYSMESWQFYKPNPLKEDSLWEGRAIFLDLASSWLLED